MRQAIPGLDGLLRRVRVPEFAGTVAPEAQARSPRPCRGGCHACTYCLAGPMRVLIVDGSTRPIAQLKVGDVVVGTERVAGVRRYTATRVSAHWSTTKPAFAVRLAEGTELITSGEHRFLTDHGWRHVSGGWCRGGRRRPHLRPGSGLLGPGSFGPIPSGAGPFTTGSDSTGSGWARSPEYRRGYLCGLVRGDGVGFPSERLGLEALGRAHHLLAEARPVPVGAEPVPVGAEPGRITREAARRGSIAPVAEVVRWPESAGGEWCAGFLAGVVDACGTLAAGELHVAHTDEAVVGRIAGALHRLGFPFAVAAQPDGRKLVRLVGGAGVLRRLLTRIEPAVTRGLDGVAVEGAAELHVVAIRALGREVPMYDITTGTGDFVAEGVVSHNCSRSIPDPRR